MLVVLSAIFMLVDLFVAIMQVTVSVAIMQLEVSAVFMQVKVFAANMWVTIFTETMQVEVSVAIMQVIFSTVHYAHDYLYCSYVTVCVYVAVSSSNFIFISLIPIFHKIDQKVSKGIRHYIKFAFHLFSK